MSTAARNRSGGGSDLADTLKDFWISRPRRTVRGRVVAGVASGIGARYGIDPVLVRIALLVATVFGGFGVTLYLIGWLLLPDERDDVSALESLVGKGHSTTPPHVTIGLCIALFLTSGWTFSGWLQGTGIALTALILIGVFMLHHTRGDRNRPTAPVAGHAASASFSAQPSTLSPDETTESNYQPPAGVWDPLGADPLGWQFSDEPVTSHGESGSAPQPSGPSGPGGRPPTPRRHAVSAAITVGAMLLTAAVTSTLAILGVPWFTLDTVIGTSLAVLGIGMVFSAFTGGGRPLLGLAVPLSIAGLLVTTLPLAEMPGGGFGELNARPQSAAEVRDVYQRTGGTITLDLTDLPADSEPVKTKVAVGMGEANVILPETADVTLTCENSMGQIDCLGRQVHGLGVDDVTVTEEGVGEGPQITLDVSSMAGTVEVTRVR
jgi:phage shock protein PspC (stress-responsive transcriptional regulator)